MERNASSATTARRPQADATEDPSGPSSLERDPLEPPNPPPQGPPRETSPGRWATVGLFVLAILYTLHLAKALILPLVLGVLLSFVLAPPVTLLRRIRIPAAVASAVVVVALVAGLAGGGYALSGPAGRWLRSPESRGARNQDPGRHGAGGPGGRRCGSGGGDDSRGRGAVQ